MSTTPNSLFGELSHPVSPAEMAVDEMVRPAREAAIAIWDRATGTLHATPAGTFAVDPNCLPGYHTELGEGLVITNLADMQKSLLHRQQTLVNVNNAQAPTVAHRYVRHADAEEGLGERQSLRFTAVTDLTAGAETCVTSEVGEIYGDREHQFFVPSNTLVTRSAPANPNNLHAITTHLREMLDTSAPSATEQRPSRQGIVAKYLMGLLSWQRKEQS